MSEWSSHTTAQECTVQLRRLVRMRFLYQPIIPPPMVAMGFLSLRSESLVLCGRTEAANVITVTFREKSRRFDAGASRLRKNWRGGVISHGDAAATPTGSTIVDHVRKSERFKKSMMLFDVFLRGIDGFTQDKR